VIRSSRQVTHGAAVEDWEDLVNLADEPVSLARNRAYQTLLFAGVADGLAHGVDVAGQGGFGDDASAPDRFNQIVLAYHPLAVAHEVDQQVEDLGPRRYRLGPTGDFPPIWIEHDVLEPVLHAAP